jgi:bacterioferritin (cytochrome b1)
MTGNLETISELFECAIALERAAETLYKQLEKMFSHYPEVALFWKQYAEEEYGHATYLERTKARIDMDRLSRPADVKMLQRVRNCLEKALPTILANVQTLEDAHQLATELENSKVNTILEFMSANFSTEELAQSKFLQTQLSVHIARLENDFPNPYKSRTARQNVLASIQNSDQYRFSE